MSSPVRSKQKGDLEPDTKKFDRKYEEFASRKHITLKTIPTAGRRKEAQPGLKGIDYSACEQSESRIYPGPIKQFKTYPVFGMCHMTAGQIIVAVCLSVLVIISLWVFVWLFYAVCYAFGVGGSL